MRKLIVLVILAFVASLFTAGSASANPSFPPVSPVGTHAPAPSAPKMSTATCSSVYWDLVYGGIYQTSHKVASDRNPTWHVYSEDCSGHGANLYFQYDRNLVCYHFTNGIHDGTYASNTYGISAPGSLNFQDDGNIVIRDSSGAVHFATNIFGSANFWELELQPDCSFYLTRNNTNGTQTTWQWWLFG